MGMGYRLYSGKQCVEVKKKGLLRIKFSENKNCRIKAV